MLSPRGANGRGGGDELGKHVQGSAVPPLPCFRRWGRPKGGHEEVPPCGLQKRRHPGKGTGKAWRVPRIRCRREKSWASSCLANAPPAEAPAGAMTAPSGPVRPSSAALAKTSAVADGPLLCLRRSWSGAAGMTRADKSSTGCHPGLGKALASRLATSRRARQAPSTGGAGKGRVGLGRVWPCDHRTGDHRPAPSRRGGQVG